MICSKTKIKSRNSCRRFCIWKRYRNSKPEGGHIRYSSNHFWAEWVCRHSCKSQDIQKIARHYSGCSKGVSSAFESATATLLPKVSRLQEVHNAAKETNAKQELKQMQDTLLKMKQDLEHRRLYRARLIKSNCWARENLQGTLSRSWVINQSSTHS